MFGFVFCPLATMPSGNVNRRMMSPYRHFIKHFIQFVVLHPDFCLCLVLLSVLANSRTCLRWSKTGVAKTWEREVQLGNEQMNSWGGLICSSHTGCDQTDYLMQSHETFSCPSQSDGQGQEENIDWGRAAKRAGLLGMCGITVWPTTPPECCHFCLSGKQRLVASNQRLRMS